MRLGLSHMCFYTFQKHLWKKKYVNKNELLSMIQQIHFMCTSKFQGTLLALIISMQRSFVSLGGVTGWNLLCVCTADV